MNQVVAVPWLDTHKWAGTVPAAPPLDTKESASPCRVHLLRLTRPSVKDALAEHLREAAPRGIWSGRGGLAVGPEDVVPVERL